MPDENEYPTEEELKTFKKWEIRGENIGTFYAHDVVEHLQQIWWYPERQLELREGREQFRHKKVMKLALHTGGWSGNEDVIGELQETWFWILYWVASYQGGHYCFEIPWKDWNKVKIGTTNPVTITLHK